MLFRDRLEAGQALAERLAGYADRPDVIVLGLARGGVAVAYEIALRLHAPLDVLLVRKLGAPGFEELALGAIAPGGVCVLNDRLLEALGLSSETLEILMKREREELQRRERLYRRGRPALEVENRVALLVDDGLATGSTMRAAVAAARQRRPAKIVVAVPVAAPSACVEVAAEVDEVVCLATPESFDSVGQWYEDFTQVDDGEVRDLLDHAEQALQPRHG
ncbi:MAG: phosphoribosyltransferase [Planctomycetes bacterium]|nr:phosphoribosyltransferase [Planctomycetota bacterium]